MNGTFLLRQLEEKSMESVPNMQNILRPYDDLMCIDREIDITVVLRCLTGTKFVHRIHLFIHRALLSAAIPVLP